VSPANLPRSGDALSFILPSGTTGLAGAIRRAVGADDATVIRCRTPQFTRPFGWPDPAGAPVGWAEFTALFSLTKAQLKELGCGSWDGQLMLFPAEWYGSIPDGFPVTDIGGKVEPFRHRVTSDDIRYGLLAYGVPAKDGEVTP
jgi:hypothetical protein